MIYKYKAKNLCGEYIKGIEQVENEEQLGILLRKKSYFLIHCKIKKKRYISINMKKSTFKDISIFCKEFSIALKSGISIIQILDLLYCQPINKSIKNSIIKIKEYIENGLSLHKSLEYFQNIYPEFMVNMVYLGEETGKLEEIFNELAKYYEKEYKYNKKIKQALLYPKILLLTSIIVFFFICIKVIPTFTQILSSLGGNIPDITRKVISLSIFIKNNIIKICIFNVVLIILMKSGSLTKKGKLIVDTMKFKIPILRDVYRKLAFMKFCKSMYILLDCGINLLKAFEITFKTIDNSFFKAKLTNVVEELKKGKSIHQCFDSVKLFSKFFISLIAIGEETGNVDNTFLRIAEILDEELSEKSQKISTLIEPIVIIVLSLIIGIIMISVMLPMLNILDTIGKY